MSMTKLCYECGSEKDEACYSVTGTEKNSVKSCSTCEGQYSDFRLNQDRAPSKNVLHIDAYKNMRSIPSKTGYVYFVKELDRCHVLVGHTLDLSAELNALQNCFYEDLICLLALPGTPLDLDRVKSSFAEYQHGNWLSYGDALAKWIIRAKRKALINMDTALDLVGCRVRIKH